MGFGRTPSVIWYLSAILYDQPLPAINRLDLRVGILHLLLTFILVGWSVPNLSSFLSTVSDTYALQPIRFARTPLHSPLSSKMLFYKTFSVLALAASMASPAFSSPVPQTFE